MIKKQSTLKKSINECRNFAKKMPKTINEAINFEEDYPEHDMDDEFDERESEHDGPKSEKMDVMGFVDEIRKKSLTGMAQLADNPDDPGYEVLKRIWQICDKAYNDQKQGQMQQQGQMQPQHGQNMQQETPYRPM